MMPQMMPQMNLERVAIKLGGYEVLVQLAKSKFERMKGLMFRRQMPENEGMLFVWKKDTSGGMHMGNCYIPLDVLFCDKDGIILDILHNISPGIEVTQMDQWKDVTSYYTDVKYRFMLELNAGFCIRHKIRIGDTI